MTDTIGLMEKKRYVGVAVGSFQKKGRPVDAATRLTPRQHEILRLLARGFYYKEIGAALGISHCTVRAHLHTVYQKLEVKSRALAVIKFQEQFPPRQN